MRVSKINLEIFKIRIFENFCTLHHQIHFKSIQFSNNNKISKFIYNYFTLFSKLFDFASIDNFFVNKL